MGVSSRLRSDHRQTVSDESIGKTIADSMEKFGKKCVITVEEGSGLQNELDVVEGIAKDGLKVPSAA